MAFPALAKVAEVLIEAEKEEQKMDDGQDEVKSYSKEIGKNEVDNLPKELGKDEMSNLPKEISLRNKESSTSKIEKPEKKGGSYKDVRVKGEGKTKEVHHIPAKEISPLNENDGPAIKMDIADHRKTASWGNSRDARDYRASQKKLIEAGKFREAMQMDIDDIREKFGDKYEDAIAEMMDYVDQLEQEGRI